MYKSTSDLYWCHRTETLSKIQVHFEPLIPGLIRDARDILHRSWCYDVGIAAISKSVRLSMIGNWKYSRIQVGSRRNKAINEGIRYNPVWIALWMGNCPFHLYKSCYGPLLISGRSPSFTRTMFFPRTQGSIYMFFGERVDFWRIFVGQILGSMGQSGSWHVALCIPTKQGYLHSLKLSANAPENRPFSPKGEDHLPTIYLRCYLLVSGRATFIVQLSRKCYIYINQTIRVIVHATI